MAHLSEERDFKGRLTTVCDCGHNLSHHAMALRWEHGETVTRWECDHVGCKCKVGPDEVELMWESARCAA